MLTKLLTGCCIAVLGVLSVTGLDIARSKTAMASVASSQAKVSDTMSSNAPLAYQIFCMRHPAQCKTDSLAKVVSTNRVKALLKSVNLSVNRAIRYSKDRGEVWSVNVAAGDCEDYALTKRWRLIRAGLPAGALRMAIAYTEKGEGHAILVVRTTSGEMVLDNRRNKIIPRNHIGYRMVSMASSDPRIWNKASPLFFDVELNLPTSDEAFLIEPLK
jgi:predicted transglutaminase-like cysteine proteinase